MYNIKYLQLCYDLILSNFCCYLFNSKYWSKEYLFNIYLIFFLNISTSMKSYKLKSFLASIVDRIGHEFIKLKKNTIKTGGGIIIFCFNETGQLNQTSKCQSNFDTHVVSASPDFLLRPCPYDHSSIS